MFFFRSRKTEPVPIPDVPMAMLTALPLKEEHWAQIARDASWQTTRMNLNTFERHGVFKDSKLTSLIADRLRDPAQIAKAKVLPYQLMVAFQMTASLPRELRDSLQDAMELATANVPEITGKVWVFVDVSGSMHSSVTGYRPGATSVVRCVDVAGLIAAAMLRRNKDVGILAFSDHVVDVKLNTRDSVMTNAAWLASLPAGGTNCSAPMAWLNARSLPGDLIIYVSDNESWLDQSRARGTETMVQWNQFKQRNPGAKLVCIDLQPYTSTQAHDRTDILNIGGFSDTVFELIARYATGQAETEHWAEVIRKIEV